MKSIILSILFVTCLIFSCKENKERPVEYIKKNYPEMIFESKIVDMGKVKEGAILSADYKFSNSSKDTLRIKYVNPECSCTSYSLSSKVILPGEKGVINLKLDTKDKAEKNIIHAVVCTNTKTKFYKLTLKAFVE